MSEFLMPSLGADMEAGTLTEWYVKPGDKVKRGDAIAEVETQKGLIDIEVYEDGVIEKLVMQVGDKVPVGTVLAIISGEKEKAGETPKAVTEKQKGEILAEQKIAVSAAPAKDVKRIKVSPLARKIAEELGVDLSKVKGTGDGGVIHREDVENAAKLQKQSPVVETPPVKKPEAVIAEKLIEEAKTPVPASDKMRMAIAAAMSRSNREIPHYYLESRIDLKLALEWLEAENKKRNIKERILQPALLLKAVAKALTVVPQLNAYWQDNQIQIQEAINIGFAISLRQGGLVIPAILNADMKSLDEMMKDMLDITIRARESKLRSIELSSSTITVTNLGERGAEKVFGVIYPPQVAILGFGKVTEQPWASNGMVGVHPVVTATLAADHRATDGHTGSKFLEALNNFLQKPETL